MGWYEAGVRLHGQEPFNNLQMCFRTGTTYDVVHPF